MADPLAGVGLLVTAGVVNTGFAVSMKRIRGWNFENTWFVWAGLGLVILPLTLTCSTIPRLGQVYSDCGPVVRTVAALGLAWGISQIFLGMAVATVGIGVSFAVILGISAAVGSLVPLVERGTHVPLTTGGLALTAGMLVLLAGVTVCAKAGWQRDQAIQANTAVTTRGLAYCLLAGVGSGLMNLALVLGAPVIAAAVRSGAQPVWAPNAVWLPFLWSGAIPNLAYCFWLLHNNRSFARYFEGGNACWQFAVVMSICWLGSAVLYTLGAGQMGTWGPVFAWPVYMSLIVITGNIAGVLMGEWKAPSSVPMRRMAQGVGLLTIAVFLLAGIKAKP